MLCGLGEEKCTKFRKQTMKKDKKLNAAKSVGRDQRWSPRGRPWPRGHILKSLALKVKS